MEQDFSDEDLDMALAAQREFEKAYEKAEKARAKRDAMVQMASNGGRSAYEIAKYIDLSQQMVGRIIKRQ